MKYNFNKFKFFFNSYANTLDKKLRELPLENLFKAVKIIEKTIKNKKYIYVCGNGGSAAIADHYICDFFKQLSKYTKLKAKIKSFNSDQYLISAISNDISYDKVFQIQAERYCSRGDIIILISSSGNSKNIVNLLKHCKKNKIKTIGFSNFNGGFLKKNCTVSVHSKIDNYGVGEDINHILMHMMMQHIALNNLKTKKKKIIL